MKLEPWMLAAMEEGLMDTGEGSISRAARVPENSSDDRIDESYFPDPLQNQ